MARRDLDRPVWESCPRPRGSQDTSGATPPRHHGQGAGGAGASSRYRPTRTRPCSLTAIKEWRLDRRGTISTRLTVLLAILLAAVLVADLVTVGVRLTDGDPTDSATEEEPETAREQLQTSCPSVLERLAPAGAALPDEVCAEVNAVLEYCQADLALVSLPPTALVGRVHRYDLAREGIGSTTVAVLPGTSKVMLVCDTGVQWRFTAEEWQSVRDFEKPEGVEPFYVPPARRARPSPDQG